MALDDELQRALDAAARSLTPTPPPVEELLVRAQRRRRVTQSTVGGAAAALLLVVAFVAVTRPTGQPTTDVASGTNATVPSPVEDNTSPSVDTTELGAPTATASSPPASIVNPGVSTTTTNPSTSSTTSTTNAPPTDGDVVVTQADDGKSFTLHEGQRLVVNLAGDGWTYTEPDTDNATVLPRVGGSADDASGDASATFTGATAGTAQVTSTKDARCRKSNPPCMTPSYLFKITVTVTP
jgi:hypothetical protein